MESKDGMTKGILYIISAPSGAGKTSLLKALFESDESIHISVSHTTRVRRPDERDSVDYHFVDTDTFFSMIEKGLFLEHAEVFGNHYGTTKATISESLDKGFDTVLEIDWQGARQVKRRFPDAVSVFILPPDKETLLHRLTSRGQDSQKVIQHRMQKARNEISHYAEYDYLVINDDFDQALADLKAVVASYRLREPAQAVRFAAQLYSLLNE